MKGSLKSPASIQNTKVNGEKNVTLTYIILMLVSAYVPIQVTPNEGMWYAFLRGESLYTYMSFLIVTPLIVSLLILKINKISIKRIESRFLIIYQICGILILLAGLSVFPQYYDVIYFDGTTYTFVSNRVFVESKSYTIEDIVHCHMKNTSDIWVMMRDGEKIYISYGITIHSKNLNDTYITGKLEHDIHNILAENNVLLTIEDRAKIQNKINKYQKRSTIDWWHEHLPQIVSNIP